MAGNGPDVLIGRVLCQIILIGALRNKLQQILVPDKGDHMVQYKILNLHAADRLLIAVLLSLLHAIVVVMARTCMAGAADAHHHGPTFAAK